MPVSGAWHTPLLAAAHAGFMRISPASTLEPPTRAGRRQRDRRLAPDRARRRSISSWRATSITRYSGKQGIRTLLGHGRQALRRDRLRQRAHQVRLLHRSLRRAPGVLRELTRTMCGIVGFFHESDSAARFDTAASPRVLEGMLALMYHRGPDEAGYYFDERTGFGTARLSIIDLSTGQQPIPDETKRFWIAYNGELYNYKELRVELEAPRPPLSVDLRHRGPAARLHAVGRGRPAAPERGLRLRDLRPRARRAAARARPLRQAAALLHPSRRHARVRLGDEELPRVSGRAVRARRGAAGVDLHDLDAAPGPERLSRHHADPERLVSEGSRPRPHARAVHDARLAGRGPLHGLGRARRSSAPARSSPTPSVCGCGATSRSRRT